MVFGSVTVAALMVFLATSFLSDQVILDNITGDALVSAIQSKLNYNAVSFISLVVLLISAFVSTAIIFSRYVMRWDWATGNHGEHTL